LHPNFLASVSDIVLHISIILHSAALQAYNIVPSTARVAWAIVTTGGGICTGAIETVAIETGAPATVAIETGTVATLAVTVRNVPAATAAFTCKNALKGKWGGLRIPIMGSINLSYVAHGQMISSKLPKT